MATFNQISAKEYFKHLPESFHQNQVPENQGPMKAYMRGQFEYYGIKAPLRKELIKKQFQAYGKLSGTSLQTLMELCWQAPQRELHLAVVDMAINVIKKQEADFMETVETCIVHKSWWDTVDFLSGRLTGELMLKFPELIPRYPDRWINSDNFWLVRSAILYQLHYKEKMDVERMFSYILQHMASNEFFIQKASGWILRHYSRTDQAAVRAFVEKHESKMSTVTRREAVKYL